MNSTNFRIVLFVSFTLLAVGCGKFASSTYPGPVTGAVQSVKPIGTCDRKDVALFNMCVEAIGSEYNEPGYLAIMQSSCEDTGGAYSSGRCDRTVSLGTCVAESGNPTETHSTFYSPLYTLESALAICDSVGGIFYSK